MSYRKKVFDLLSSVYCVERTRFAENGSVHVFGPVPGSTESVWWVAGWGFDLLLLVQEREVEGQA